MPYPSKRKLHSKAASDAAQHKKTRLYAAVSCDAEPPAPTEPARSCDAEPPASAPTELARSSDGRISRVGDENMSGVFKYGSGKIDEG